MYLSRLRLDPRSRAVRRDLRDLQAIHRTIMSAYPHSSAAARRAHGVLWRLEPDAQHDAVLLLVQSAIPPDWSTLPPGYLAADLPATKPIDAMLASIVTGMRLRFRLLANPTVKIDTRSTADGGRRNGRRVPVRGDGALLAWLARKGAESGFTVGHDPADVARAVVVRPVGDLIGWRRRDSGDGTSRLTLRGIAFDGILTITDADRARAGVAAGIGSGKAYGFGLLSLAPVNRPQ